MKNRTVNILAAILIGTFTVFVIWQCNRTPAVEARAVNENIAENSNYSETYLTREEADVIDARNGDGRWKEVLPDATPDHIDQEKVDDEISENFGLMCDVVFAESGNQGIHGMKLVADVIINRMRLGEAFDDTLHDVLNAPNQFSCIKDGGAAKWHGHTRPEVRKLVQEELVKVTDPTIFYFRTGRYTEYGADAYKYKDVYFSRRK